MKHGRQHFYLLAAGLCVLLCVSGSNPFFWDTILYSRIAGWFLDHGFGTLILPENLDTGNQPFFELLLAIAWKIAGRHLWTAHLLMLPFVLVIAFQCQQLIQRFVPGNQQWIAVLWLLIQPVLLSQTMLVSLDIVIAALYLWGINALLEDRRSQLWICCVLLALTNLRGTWLIGSLLLCDLYIHFTMLKERKFRIISSYAPAAVLAISWFAFHYAKAGWWLHQPAEWAGHRQLVGPVGLFRNVLFTVWRFFDFGGFALCSFCLLMLIRKVRQKALVGAERQLLAFILIPFFWMMLLFLPFSNPIGHRYFLVILILIPILAARFLFAVSKPVKLVVIVFTLFAVVAGNSMFYTPPFANGWDSTPVHVFYFKLQREMRDYISARHIAPITVATDFPCSSSWKDTDLQDDYHYSNKWYGGMNMYSYVLQSNINNHFQREELKELQRWTLIKEMRNGPIYMRLYKKPVSR